MKEPVTEPVVCLGCGGIVRDGGAREPVPERDIGDDGPLSCECAPATVAYPVVSETAEAACSACGGGLTSGARGCPYCRATVATRRCGACEAWNFAESRECVRCGKRLAEIGAPPDSVAPDHVCPRCPGRLRNRRYADLTVEECDACGGMLLAPPMMDRIVGARDASTSLRLALPKRRYQRETEFTHVLCPACPNIMNRRVFAGTSGVTVDVCTSHGVWFDPGELGEVIAFVERAASVVAAGTAPHERPILEVLAELWT